MELDEIPFGRKSIADFLRDQLRYGPIHKPLHCVAFNVRQLLIEILAPGRGTQNPDGSEAWSVPEQLSPLTQEKILGALHSLTETQRRELYKLTQQDALFGLSLYVLEAAILRGRTEIPVEDIWEAKMVNMLHHKVPPRIAEAIRPLMQEWQFGFSEVGELEHTPPERYSNTLLEKAREALRGVTEEEIENLRKIEYYGTFADFLLSIQQDPWLQSAEAAVIEEQCALLEEEWPREFLPESRNAVRRFLHRIFQVMAVTKTGNQLSFYYADSYPKKGVQALKDAIAELPHDELPLIFSTLLHAKKTDFFKDAAGSVVFQALMQQAKISRNELFVAALADIDQQEPMPLGELNGIWILIPHWELLRKNKDTLERRSAGRYPRAVLEKAHAFFQDAGKDFRLRHTDGRSIKGLENMMGDLEAIHSGNFSYLIGQEAAGVAIEAPEALPKRRLREADMLHTIALPAQESSLPPHAQELPSEQALSITRGAHEWKQRQEMRDSINGFLRKKFTSGFCPFKEAVAFLQIGGLVHRVGGGSHPHRFEDDKGGKRPIDYGRYKKTGIPLPHMIGFMLGHGKLPGIGYPERILQEIQKYEREGG